MPLVPVRQIVRYILSSFIMIIYDCDDFHKWSQVAPNGSDSLAGSVFFEIIVLIVFYGWSDIFQILFTKLYFLY